MSRSLKKVAAGGICGCKSEKYDKQHWHRRFRVAERKTIKNCLLDSDEFDDSIFPHIRDVSNPWSMMKDGKVIYFRRFFKTKRLLQWMNTEEFRNSWRARYRNYYRSIVSK